MAPASPRVSVIIPCHNHARYLGEALASVAAQGPAVAEIVVVDDGSTDGSADVAREFSAGVKVISQAQQGIAAARNAGVRVAQGDFLAFLDADDLWPEGSLAARLSRFEQDPALEAVFGHVEQFLSPELDEARRAELHCPPGQAAVRLAGSLLIRRNTFDRIGFFDAALKIGETMDWVARLDSDGAPVTSVDDLVLRRRIHGANTVLTQGVSPSSYLQVLRASLRRKAAAAGEGN